MSVAKRERVFLECLPYAVHHDTGLVRIGVGKNDKELFTPYAATHVGAASIGF